MNMEFRVLMVSSLDDTAQVWNFHGILKLETQVLESWALRWYVGKCQESGTQSWFINLQGEIYKNKAELVAFKKKKAVGIRRIQLKGNQKSKLKHPIVLQLRLQN